MRASTTVRSTDDAATMALGGKFEIGGHNYQQLTDRLRINHFTNGEFRERLLCSLLFSLLLPFHDRET
jgi:hypothetical protein